VFGGLLYWTKHPNSIFTDWKKYLIVGILFALVDAFIFLGMYILKVGNHELAIATKQIEINDEIVNSNREKVKRLVKLLKEQGIPEYYNSEEEYISLLSILLEEYAEQEGLELELLKFHTQIEKEEAFKEYRGLNKSFIQKQLQKDKTYIKKKMAYIPIFACSKKFVLKVTSQKEVTEMDLSLINLLLITFDLVIREGTSNGGEE
jgi:stage II sporulation protein SA